MRRGRALAALGLAATAVAGGAGAAEARVERPIVYAVVIDQLDGDKVDAGRAPFISSLLAGNGASATYYRESRSIVTSDTNPNHVAMVTGAYAEGSGIPSNAFAIYSELENEDSCRPTGGQNLRGAPSATSGENENCLLAQTAFESVKRQRNPDRLLTAGIFGKPKLGKIFSGRRFDGRRRDVDHLWAPCGSGSDDDDYCGEVPKNPVGDSLTDSVTMDEVIKTIREGTRKERRRPDFTFVNLHQVDRSGHVFGPGPAYDEAIALADNEIERLVRELRSRGEWGRTVLVLLSDHSVDAVLRRVDLQTQFTAAGISGSEAKIVHPLGVSVAHAFLADRTSADRFALLKRMRAAALASPDVAEALYREPNPLDGGTQHTVDGAHPGWHATHVRSGDLLVLPAPGASFADDTLETPTDPLPGAHGASQTRDNFFAVIGGGPFVRQATLEGQAGPMFDDTLQNPGQAENVDVASTVMGLFGLFEPRHDAGRFLSEAFNLAALPGRGAPVRAPRLSARCISSRAACRARRSARPRRGPAFTGAVGCGTTLRYRLRWSPAGGHYDLELRSGGRHRRLLRNREASSHVLALRRGQRVRLRIRSRSAAGTPSAWTRRALRVPRCS